MLDFHEPITQAVQFEPAQLEPLSGFPAVVDNSMRQTFVACPQKFFRHYIQGWTSRIPSIHLHAGGAFAFGIETVRRKYFAEGLPANEAIAAGYEAVLRRYGDYITSEDDVKTATRMAGALLFYFDAFPLESDYVVPAMIGEPQRPAIEFSFVIPLPVQHPDRPNEPILYSGRFDMLGRRGDTLWVVDEKTTSQLGASWPSKWTHAAQFTGYCWGARQFGLEVEGAIIRGISILKGGYGKAESIQTRPQWVVDRWYSQLLRDVNRMVECYKTGVWDYNLDASCSAYGGCPFVDVCNSNDPDTWLRADFTVREYKPNERN